MKVEDYLATKNVEFDVIPHHDTYGAQRMAQALHVSGKEVAKTVLLRANHGFKYLVAVLPANKSIDFERASQALGGSRLELATETEITEHCPDCEVGALPPFGSQYGMETIVDESLAEDDEIVFEGNTHHESIRLKFQDFCDIEGPLVASFAR
jgi:Ala-tRNA(Pro) deacylase